MFLKLPKRKTKKKHKELNNIYETEKRGGLSLKKQIQLDKKEAGEISTDQFN